MKYLKYVLMVWVLAFVQPGNAEDVYLKYFVTSNVVNLSSNYSVIVAESRFRKNPALQQELLLAPDLLEARIVLSQFEPACIVTNTMMVPMSYSTSLFLTPNSPEFIMCYKLFDDRVMMGGIRGGEVYLIQYSLPLEDGSTHFDVKKCNINALVGVDLKVRESYSHRVNLRNIEIDIDLLHESGPSVLLSRVPQYSTKIPPLRLRISEHFEDCSGEVEVE